MTIGNRMTIKDKLEDLFIEVNESDAEAQFESCGMYDHEGMRAFGQNWGTVIAHLAQEDGKELGPEDLGSSMVGGVLLGLLLAKDGFLLHRSEP